MVKTNVENLGKWSKVEIEVICDDCGLEKKLQYKLYTSYGYLNGLYFCRNCKLKRNNLEKWGVENVFQLPEVKEKSKKTNLEKWGVEFISQSTEIKEKVSESKSKLDYVEINSKRVKTNLEKWGVENISQSEEVKKYKINTYSKNWKSPNNKTSESFRKDRFIVSSDEHYIRYLEKGFSEFNCDLKKNHVFSLHIDNYLRRRKYKTVLCSVCNPLDTHQSGQEISIFNYIKNIYNGEVIQNFRIGKCEIDIYIPELKFGIEFNGIYWHSEKYKEKNFHLKKTLFFNDKNIDLFHIWEDDWIHKSDIIKSQLSNKLNLNKRVFARNCQVRIIEDIKLVKDFLNENHIQGYVNSNKKIGLFIDGELLSIMTFDKFEGRKKLSEYEWNLNRFCNKLNTSVVGGASKLLSHFIKINNPKRIISYADRDWSSGNLYEKLLFTKLYETEPDYKYVVSDKRLHKSNYRRSKTGVSEKELPYERIWDCGKIKYERLIS